MTEYKCTNKDLYFLDDTHWPPLTSKIIANKLKSMIE